MNASLIFHKYIMPAIEVIFIFVFYLMFCTYDWRDSSFNLEVLKTPKVYITGTLLSYICTFIYNFIQERVMAYNKAYHPNAPAQFRLWKTLKTNELRCAHAYTVTEVVEEAVLRKNEKNKIAECNRILHEVNTSMDFKEIDFKALSEDYQKEVERLEKKFCIHSKKLKKKFEKVLQKIAIGKVKYEQITAEDVLVNGFADDQRVKSLKNRTNTIKTFKVVFHAVSQIFMFIAMSVVFLDLVFTWNTEIIITYLFYLLFAIVGGGSYGASMVNYTTTLYTQRNNFFVEYCGIADTWDGSAQPSDAELLKKSIKERFNINENENQEDHQG